MKTLLSGVTKSNAKPITLTEQKGEGWTVACQNSAGKREARTYGVYPPALALYLALAVSPIVKQ